MKLPNLNEISNASRQVATQSAMNPILWKSAIVSSVAMISAVFAESPVNYVLLGIAALPVISGCWGFYHFAKRDPRRLQSERHVEQMEIIGRIGDNISGTVIEFNPNSSPSNNTKGE